jgi:signal transduction histidine kinase
MLRVMIVDDEASIRLTLQAFFRDQGYAAEVAENAQQALVLLSKQDWDVVVTDIVLPGVSGVDLLKAIRAVAPYVEVIMMTGEPTVETAAEAVRDGACDYLTKPVDKRAILRAVAHAAKIKSLDDNRRSIEADLRSAKAAAEMSNRAKSEFLAGMSHELRTPLGAIIGFSELLQEKIFGALNPKQEEYIQDILESGRHLLSLINDILDLTKIEAGRMALESSSVPIATLLEHSLMMVQENAHKHGIALSVEVMDAVKDLTITADERKLKQILFNLLSNAVKFTPDGGAIKVSARLDTETSMLPYFGTPTLLISVSDTGVGIAKEYHEKVFEEFYQVKDGAKGKTAGTGLGLALTRRLVELHVGRIWMESEGEGKGSTFRFTIPARHAE